MKLAELLKILDSKQFSTRSLVYLSIALIVQILFWYHSMPGPQITEDYEPGIQRAAIFCFISTGVFLAIPLLSILLFRDSLGWFYLGYGDIKYGLSAIVVVTPVFVLATVLGSNDASLYQFYPLPGDVIGQNWITFGTWAACYACFYVSFEFFYRGFLLSATREFDLAQRLILSVACCVLIHVGKPFAETMASIPASLLFGWITIRCRSIWYAFVIHFVVGLTNDIAALYHRGSCELFPWST